MFELALRTTVVLIAAWVLTRLLRRATAATRHLVWHVAMLASIAIGLASLANVPKLRIVPVMPSGLLVRNVIPSWPPTDALPQTASAPSVGTQTPTPQYAPALGAHVLRRTLDAQFAVGALGTLAVGLWFAMGWISASRLSRRAKPAPLAWQLELQTLCERLQISGPVRLRLVEQSGSPLATGLFRATILLPKTAAAWSADRRRAVLLHELAHIKRRDCRVQLVAQVACALYWFNPAVWSALAQLRREREHACDDEVLRLGSQASSYAAHLLDIAREMHATWRPSAALAMARPSELEGRLVSVLAVNRRRVPARGSRWAVILVLSSLTVIAMSVSPRAENVAAVPVPNPSPHYVVGEDVVMSAEPTPEPLSKSEDTLYSSSRAEDREMATLALAFTSGRDVIPALLKALRDPDAQVREKAAIGLALRRDSRIVAPLLVAMSDPDAQVREKVAIALGTSGDARAYDALTRALDDPDPQVREKAVSALVLLQPGS